MRETHNFVWMKYLYGLFSPKLEFTCRVIYETQIISTLYVEGPDNYFVEITKDLVLKRMNRKTSDCGGIPTEVTKLFSTVKEVIGLDGGWGKRIAECIIRFRNKVLGMTRCEANKVVGLKWIFIFVVPCIVILG